MNEYLEHSGVKGMKWGVRRYQNKDGSLTPAGRKRLGYGDTNSNTTKQAKSKANRSLGKPDSKLSKFISRKKNIHQAKQKIKRELKAEAQKQRDKRALEAYKDRKERLYRLKPKNKGQKSNPINPLKSMSNEELKAVNERLRLENEYKELKNPAKVKKGDGYVKKFAQSRLNEFGSAAMKVAAPMVVNALMSEFGISNKSFGKPNSTSNSSSNSNSNSKTEEKPKVDNKPKQEPKTEVKSMGTTVNDLLKKSKANRETIEKFGNWEAQRLVDLNKESQDLTDKFLLPYYGEKKDEKNK